LGAGRLGLVPLDFVKLVIEAEGEDVCLILVSDETGETARTIDDVDADKALGYTELIGVDVLVGPELLGGPGMDMWRVFVAGGELGGENESRGEA
jgi:hypothetical protein